ncbi:mtDNA inheritance, partitioning of the mitochondrial organelle [Entomortierella chlamydospora]|uniref:MtDNA inheritance, partitioning of the mitochondrial organelle n=1 Tax=Entomortierella chlamydospora TaxID=101097 RepID=A0A9P6N1M6_9FUNG|nr:mtDNA inheritance, partitioning of the mitochondrial organelle [Entomortierella chlamydospora]
MHEIVTLQFGHFANFVGAHYWNTQDAHFNYEQPADDEEITPELINHDCLYRIGMTSKLAAEEEEDNVAMNDVKTWSDFSRVYFHPKSMVTMSGYQLNSEFMPFDVFSYGRAAFIETEKEKESYDENLRLFMEECDQLQGFQVLVDVLDGWGGFATSFLERLREDYPKSALITYGLSDDQMGKSNTLRERQVSAANEILSMASFSKLSSLYVPVRAPTQSMLSAEGWSKNINMNPSSRYHTSAFISAGVDSALLPGRLRRGSIFMPDMIGSLNWRNITTIGTLSVGLPFPFGSKSIPPLAGKWSPLLDLSSRNEDIDDQVFSQSVVLRGLETDQFARYTTGTQNTPRGFVDELLDTLPIGKSLGDSNSSPPNLRVDGTSIDSAKRINWRMMTQFEGDGPGGVNSDEFEEAKESLLDMYDIYNE